MTTPPYNNTINVLTGLNDKSGQTIQYEQMGLNVETGLNVQSGPCGQTDRTDQTSPNFQLSGHAQDILDKQTVKSDHTAWEVQQHHLCLNWP